MNDVPIILKPLTPEEVYENQKVLRQRVEEFEKEKSIKRERERERERVCIKKKRQTSKRRVVRKAMRGVSKERKKVSLRGCAMRKREMRMQKES